MNVTWVWSRIFPFPRGVIGSEMAWRQENVCKWVVKAHQEGRLTRNATGNLVKRMKLDYDLGGDYWRFISESRDYDDFVANLPEYTRIRQLFPSRDRLPVDPGSLPLSNEKMYGKGINSRVRD